MAAEFGAAALLVEGFVAVFSLEHQGVLNQLVCAVAVAAGVTWRTLPARIIAEGGTLVPEGVLCQEGQSPPLFKHCVVEVDVQRCVLIIELFENAEAEQLL